MANDNFQIIMDNIESQNLGSIYVLEGEEPFYIDQLMKAFEEKAMPEEGRDFNQTVLYGNEVDWKQVINEARRMPMFGDRILILLKEANQMRSLPELAAYFEHPSPQTTLVIEMRGKKIDGRSRLANLVKKKATHFVSDKIKEQQLPSWIQNYAQGLGLNVPAREADMLSAYLGNDLKKIANELEKIQISEPEVSELNASLIEKYIGISREYNVFELIDSFFSGNRAKMAQILNYFTANPKSLTLVLFIGSLHNFFSRVYAAYYAKSFAEQKKYGVWQQHEQFAKRFSLAQTLQLILIAQEYAQKTVGIGYKNTHPVSLVKECFGRMSVVLK